jgi:hypothetical protein
VLSAVRHDAAASTLLGQHVELGGPGIRLRPWRLHYQPLDTLDRLAGASGLDLMARWCSWTGEPYESSSETAISLWRRR